MSRWGGIAPKLNLAFGLRSLCCACCTRMGRRVSDGGGGGGGGGGGKKENKKECQVHDASVFFFHLDKTGMMVDI